MMRYVVILLALVLPHVAVGSEIVFSNLGPNYSFSQQSGQLITGPDANLGGIHPGNYDEGVKFTVSPSQDYSLDTIEVPFAVFEGASSAMVRIFNDASGVPGAELGSVELNAIPATPTLLTADFRAQSISLAAGSTYWVVGDAALDTVVSWYFNEVGQLGDAYRTTGAWVPEALGATSGVRVNGTAVPETISSALVAVACLLVFAGRWTTNARRLAIS